MQMQDRTSYEPNARCRAGSGREAAGCQDDTLALNTDDGARLMLFEAEAPSWRR